MTTFKLGRPNVEVFADDVLALARQDRNVLVVTGDSRGSAKLGPFGQALPDQIIELGIAEQNLVGVSAGLASAGKKVFAVSPACFLTARALEQIKNDVAYSDNPVKLIGISAGVSYGALGTTHHSLHDYAALQAINNLNIIVPADNFETREAIKAAANQVHPVYIRFGKAAMPDLHAADTTFEVGKAITLSSGADITFIVIGEPLGRAVQAREILEAEGLSCGVISLHSLRPFDSEAVLAAARNSRALVTVEEHSVYGGLGSRCAALLMEAGQYLPLKIVGIPDEYTVTGSQDEILTRYGISPNGLADIARALLRQKVG
jgi:transketolase